MDKIYSYFLYVGDWKDTPPDTIIQTKRQLDDVVYSNIIFLTPGFFDRYQAFMKAAFDLKQGWASDPALKTVPVRPLDDHSSVAFKKCDNADEVYRTYWDFQRFSQIDLKLPGIQEPPQPEQPMVAQAMPCPKD